MTTSSSTDFNLDVAEYIEEAFERCGLEAKTGYDLQTARRSMNIMLAEWANRGLNQWTIEQRTQALTANDSEYSLSTDIIDILSLVVRRDNTDFSMTRISRDTFLNLPNKTSTSRPTQYFLDRQITPNLKLYPTPENSTDVITYWRIAKIDDVTASTVGGVEQDFDVPSRFYEAMIEFKFDSVIQADGDDPLSAREYMDLTMKALLENPERMLNISPYCVCPFGGQSCD